MKQTDKETAANEKAFNLFVEYLTDAQKVEMRDKKKITLIGSFTHRRYILDVTKASENVRYGQRVYCAICSVVSVKRNDDIGFLPWWDHVLAQKLAIETDERYFLRRAIVKDRHKRPVISYMDLFVVLVTPYWPWWWRRK